MIYGQDSQMTIDGKTYGDDLGDRVKTAREMKEEATKGMDTGMINSVVNQVNNNTSQNNNTTMSGTPTATDPDVGSKLAGVPAFG